MSDRNFKPIFSATLFAWACIIATDLYFFINGMVLLGIVMGLSLAFFTGMLVAVASSMPDIRNDIEDPEVRRIPMMFICYPWLRLLWFIQDRLQKTPKNKD